MNPDEAPSRPQRVDHRLGRARRQGRDLAREPLLRHVARRHRVLAAEGRLVEELVGVGRLHRRIAREVRANERGPGSVLGAGRGPAAGVSRMTHRRRAGPGGGHEGPRVVERTLGGVPKDSVHWYIAGSCGAPALLPKYYSNYEAICMRLTRKAATAWRRALRSPRCSPSPPAANTRRRRAWT